MELLNENMSWVRRRLAACFSVFKVTVGSESCCVFRRPTSPWLVNTFVGGLRLSADGRATSAPLQSVGLITAERTAATIQILDAAAALVAVAALRLLLADKSSNTCRIENKMLDARNCFVDLSELT